MEALSNAESDISFAARRLENAFKEKNDESIQRCSDGPVPNPVKIIRRLTALELAMGQLRKDCETISKKRTNIVKSVLSKQHNNVENIEQLLHDTSIGTSDRHASRQNTLDERNWGELSNEIKVQSLLLNGEAK
ncbi:spindle and kinetochore-associated protein 2 [Nitzschia inconspicua]|uniref:Spindle and kinetochore-associated protein 2 n=1 Tax=Nitzschia inconspicua TaxID=303405 RepID=A0A9K3PVQ2_9STRA|nr:spindle and kinetochore-associated protein 2 [Nitzschia inconspicua]